MHKYLKELLECPKCHGELIWQVDKESNNRIETAQAGCSECGAVYHVEEGIGIFLTSELSRNDLWDQGSSQLAQFFNEHPEIEEKLMTSPLDDLSPADQFIRGTLLEERNQFVEAKEVTKRAFKGLYTKDYLECWEEQLDYICNRLSSYDGPIVDLASGRCYLVEALAKRTDALIVATDFSPTVLRRNRRLFEHLGLYDRISLLAFDARKTPFKNGAIHRMTTNLGLPNIEEPIGLLEELRRVVSGTFMSVMHLFPEIDNENSRFIRDKNRETFLFSSEMMKCFKATDWEAKIVNGCKGISKPTPKGELLEGAVIDGFPIEDTELEWCVLVAK